MRKYLVLSLLLLSCAGLVTVTLQNLPYDSGVAVALSSIKTFPCLSLTKNLSQGLRDTSSGSEIIKLQQFLKESGYDYLEPTGFFGANTRRALVDWQSNNAISATGYVGPLTRGAIQKATCGSSVVKVSTNTTAPILLPLQTISISSPGTGTVLKETEVLKTSWTAFTGDFTHYQVNLKNKLTDALAVSIASTRAVSTELTLSNSLIIPFLISFPGVKESAIRSNFYVEVTAERPGSVGQRSYIAFGKTGAFTISKMEVSGDTAQTVVITNFQIQDKLAEVVFDRISVTILNSNFIAELDFDGDGKITSKEVALMSNFPRVEVSMYEVIKSKIPKAISNRLFTKVGDSQYIVDFDLNNDGAILEDDLTLAQTFLSQTQVNP